ncbi:MAG: flagellar biosynthetic protein FliO [Magnetospirillum sp.]|nr:flagellar biosynthetic protein FliO [Magnetospirillum sp.]
MDSSAYLRFIASLVAVLGMIFVALWMVKRWLPGALSQRRSGGGRRLGIVESLTLDTKHRLVLIRRDDHEHLLLLGTGQGLVVEADCTPPKFTLPGSLPEPGP